jgi:hypothetical protein
MIQISRRWLALIAITFGSFLNLFGVLLLEYFNDYFWALSANLLFQVCLLVTTLAFKSARLSNWAAWLNIAAALYIPVVLHLTHIGRVIGDYSTWYVTALAVLFGSMAVRRQLALGIVGIVILSAQVFWWGGLDYVSRSGLVGAILLVFATIAISTGLDRAEENIIKLQQLRVEEENDTVLTETAREEHRLRVNDAISKALPALREIASGEKLSQEQQSGYSDLAQILEDEISGGRLVTPELRVAVAEARKRQVEVTLIDEAETEPAAELENVIDIAVATLSSINVGRVKIIAPKNEPYLVRLTATRPGVVTPDLDLKLGERQID